jgi:steroid 5-alpha reductase family enzyme
MLGNFGVQPGLVSGVFHKTMTSPAVNGVFCMIATYFEAHAAIAVSLSILMAGAWLVPQRTGNSGWADAIGTFSLGLVGAGSVLWPISGAAPNPRQWLVAALLAIWSLRPGLHVAVRARGERYRDDQSHTSVFLPLPPEKGMIT